MCSLAWDALQRQRQRQLEKTASGASLQREDEESTLQRKGFLSIRGGSGLQEHTGICSSDVNIFYSSACFHSKSMLSGWRSREHFHCLSSGFRLTEARLCDDQDEQKWESTAKEKKRLFTTNFLHEGPDVPAANHDHTLRLQKSCFRFSLTFIWMKITWKLI